MDDGVVDVPDGVRVATRGEIRGECFDDGADEPCVTCRYESTMSRFGWHAKTTVEASLKMPPEGGAVVAMQLSAVENGTLIASRNFETKIPSLLPPLALGAAAPEVAQKSAGKKDISTAASKGSITPDAIHPNLVAEPA
jgi:hypothetical protein